MGVSCKNLVNCALDSTDEIFPSARKFSHGFYILLSTGLLITYRKPIYRRQAFIVYPAIQLIIRIQINSLHKCGKDFKLENIACKFCIINTEQKR